MSLTKSVSLLLVFIWLYVCASDEFETDYDLEADFDLEADGKGTNNAKKKDWQVGKGVKLEYYELTMDTDGAAGSTATIQITLFWNNEVYQAEIVEPATTGTYRFAAIDTFQYNDYNYVDQAGTKAKMLIQNNQNSDAAIFTKMKLILEDGTFYAVDSFCADPSLVGSYYSNFILSDNKCDPGLTNYRAVCVDDSTDTACNPANLMVYFDKRNPNTVSKTAMLLDASGKVMEGCQLVVSPAMASRCKKKKRDGCERSRSCNLVQKVYGSLTTKNIFRQSYNPYLFEKGTNAIQFKKDEGLVPEYILFAVFSTSAILNVYFLYSKKRVGKF